MNLHKSILIAKVAHVYQQITVDYSADLIDQFSPFNQHSF